MDGEMEGEEEKGERHHDYCYGEEDPVAGRLSLVSGCARGEKDAQ